MNWCDSQTVLSEIGIEGFTCLFTQRDSFLVLYGEGEQIGRVVVVWRGKRVD